jgi:hypothetical protein
VKKHIWAQVEFWFRVAFGFWGGFLDHKWGFMVYRVSYRCFGIKKKGLQNRFLGQKSIGPDFLATIVAEIWAKQTTHRLARQRTHCLLLSWLLDPRRLCLTWLPDSLPLAWHMTAKPMSRESGMAVRPNNMGLTILPKPGAWVWHGY